jgi:hypothetical protein
MGRGILLWLLGVPIPIIILLALLRMAQSAHAYVAAVPSSFTNG